MNLKLTLAVPIAALSLLAAGAASAAVVTTPLNVRDAPSNSGHILGVLAEGTEVECTDIVAGWCELLDGEGYVYSGYLDFGGEIEIALLDEVVVDEVFVGEDFIEEDFIDEDDFDDADVIVEFE